MADGTRDWPCDLTTTNKDGVCDSCRAAGWITDPTIIAQEIAKDPLLKDHVQIESPIQREDLGPTPTITHMETPYSQRDHYHCWQSQFAALWSEDRAPQVLLV